MIKDSYTIYIFGMINETKNKDKQTTTTKKTKTKTKTDTIQNKTKQKQTKQKQLDIGLIIKKIIAKLHILKKSYIKMIIKGCR